MSRRRKILIVAGIVLGVAILIPVIRHYQLRAAVNEYIAELKAKGEPMDLAQVIPPPVPPEQNSAPLITNALAQIYEEKVFTNSLIFKNDPLDMSVSIAPGKKIVSWRQPFIHDPEGYGGGYYPTNTWEDLGAQLAERQNDLNAFQKLIKKPVLDFNVDYNSNPQVYARELMLHLPRLKYAVQWLNASEFYNLHFSKTADACDDVRAMLAFVKGEKDERFEISQLVRIAIAQISAEATWNILQTTNIPDEDLARLQQDWQSLEFVVPMQRAFLFERVNSMELQNKLRHFRADLLAFAQLPANNFVVKSKVNGKWTDWNGSSANFFLIDKTAFSQNQRPLFTRVAEAISQLWHFFISWPGYYSYEDELRGLKEWQIIFAATHMAETNASFQSIQSFVNTNFVQLGFNFAKVDPYAIFSRDANQLSALRKAVSAEVTRNIVITAIALKRYQLQNHQLPKTLSALVPDFLKSIQIDYMDGKPLRYRKNVDGTFLLYSVGENGKDDGGDPSQPSREDEFPDYRWQDSRALDWVWPQPATESEIQAYYKKLSSKSN